MGTFQIRPPIYTKHQQNHLGGLNLCERPRALLKALSFGIGGAPILVDASDASR